MLGGLMLFTVANKARMELETRILEWYEREISPSDHSTFALEDVLSWVPSEGNQKAKCLS